MTMIELALIIFIAVVIALWVSLPLMVQELFNSAFRSLSQQPEHRESSQSVSLKSQQNTLTIATAGNHDGRNSMATVPGN